MATAVCEACGQLSAALALHHESLVCPTCQADLDEYYAHQYSPRYTGVVDCAACGHPHSRDEAIETWVNGRLVPLCKECRTPLVFP